MLRGEEAEREEMKASLVYWTVLHKAVISLDFIV